MVAVFTQAEAFLLSCVKFAVVYNESIGLFVVLDHVSFAGALAQLLPSNFGCAEPSPMSLQQPVCSTLKKDGLKGGGKVISGLR